MALCGEQISAAKDSGAACRLILPQFLSAQECKELEFIHKSCGVVGYRPYVLSTTIPHLVATNCAHLILPLLSVRERARVVVEEHFGREYELFIEFTGLISWKRGSNIGWHSDDNRPYLQQRHFSAVCYLNDHNVDFTGGLFHFQTGEPLTVIPSIGTMIIYTADERNMHCVDKVIDGERCTLALWFTLDRVHDEDQKVIDQLSTGVPGLNARDSNNNANSQNQSIRGSQSQGYTGHAVAAPGIMYTVPVVKNELDELIEHKESTVNKWANQHIEANFSDLRVIRMASLGFSCHFTSTALEDQHEKPIVLLYRDKKVPYQFRNSLQALQAVQFHQMLCILEEWQLLQKWDTKIWCPERFSEIHEGLSTPQYVSQGHEGDCKTGIGFAQTKATNGHFSGSHVLVANRGIEKKFLECGNFGANADILELNNFLKSLQGWECYTSKLWEKLFELFPSWRTTGSLLCI